VSSTHANGHIASHGIPLVLHVIPTATARGAQREARALATCLDVPGVRHHRLLSLFAGDEQVPVDITLAHPGGDRPAQGFDPRLVIRLRAELRRSSASVVVAHGGDPLKYLVPAMLGTRTPLAYYATGTFEHAASPMRVALWRALIRRADVVAAEGDEVLEQCRQLLRVPEDHSLLAPNGRDPDEFHPPEGGWPPGGRQGQGQGQGAADAGSGPPVLAFVGALTPGKRPDRFVEVVAALRRRGVEVRAIACGGGPLAGALAGPAAAADVAMLGSRSDVAEVLRGADVFVFTSSPTGEGMPGVLIEAGMTGLATVATAVPGVRTIINDGEGGFVVDVDDLEAMVDATARLVSDGALRRSMGDAARRRCVERFSLEAVAACWLSFLEPLVERAVSARRGRSAPGTRRARGV
jgi:glycosyltransferase involved in cell wall biosynthesis